LNLVAQVENGKYDSEDRPVKHAATQVATTFELLKGTENYIHAKSVSIEGKALLAKKEREPAELRFTRAVTYITERYGNSSPLICKFKAYLVEAYNQEAESKERNDKMNKICTENLEIAKKTYGGDSIFCVKPMYTAYTARLHEESIKGCEDVLMEMAGLKYDGEKLKANQFLFKAVLIDTMLLMG
jgi:hypothetical protein